MATLVAPAPPQVRELIVERDAGQPGVVAAYMRHIQDNAEAAVRAMLRSFSLAQVPRGGCQAWVHGCMGAAPAKSCCWCLGVWGVTAGCMGAWVHGCWRRCVGVGGVRAVDTRHME